MSFYLSREKKSQRMKTTILKRLMLLSVLIGYIGGVPSASAYNELHLKKFLTSKVCVSCDLRGADLSNLSLRGAKLFYADLEGVNFKGSDLEGADLRSTNLQGSNFVDSNLKDVQFITLKRSWLSKVPVKFNRRDLDDVNFQGAIWVNGEICALDSIGHCVFSESSEGIQEVSVN